jgi:hypothetical protein
MAAQDFFEVMKMLAPGLDKLGPQVAAELSRLGTQGAMEMAQALFNGAAFTPYGPGQYTPTPQLPEAGQDVKPDTPPQELDRGGREM